MTQAEIATFNRYQEKAGREFAISGIFFDVQTVPGAYLRTQGYSEIPERFLARRAIDIVVTETLGYDIDRDRTALDPFYKTFLGLEDASDTALAHEYAHPFTLDTTRNPTVAGNVWSDLRNDFWLWRQRHGASIAAFRVNSEWAHYGTA